MTMAGMAVMPSRMRCTTGRICCFGVARRRVFGRRVGGVRQVVQVGVFGFVELQGAGDGVEHAVGDSGQVAAFQLGVVVGADSGEHGDFFAAQSRDTAAAIGGQPDLLRGDPGASGGQELPYLALAVHTARLRSPAHCWGVLAVHG